jgi:outer membrane protein assembly factor BamD
MRRPRHDSVRATLARGALCVGAASALLGLVGLTGCDLNFGDPTRATLSYTEDARAAYNQAMASFKARDWEDARALFNEVKKRFAYSRYARLAELRLADISFEQDKFSEAISGYREFVQNHRTDRDVEYAKYRICKSLFLDIDDTIFLPSREERDQATTSEAYKELRSFDREFPRSRHHVDVAYMLDVVTGRLVRHELYVARYYLKRDIFEATVARIDYAVKTFPGSSLEPEALVLKGETLLKMKKRDEARQVFDRVVKDYGGPFGGTAKSFLAEMDAQDKGRGASTPAAPAAPKPATK